MKKVKFFLWLVILIFLGLLIYQNKAYFFTPHSFTIDLKISSWQWTFTELANIVYLGICFVLGLIIAGYMGLSSKIRSKKTIRALNKTIDSHAAQISSLRTQLEVYVNDPYIKKQTESRQPEIPAQTNEKKEDDQTGDDTAQNKSQ